MTQKISTFYGIQVSTNKEITLEEYEIQSKIINDYVKKNNLTDFEAYVHKINISFKERHFGIDGLSNRCSILTFKAHLTKNQVKNDDVKLINNEINVRLTPEIEGAFKKENNKYKIPPDFIENKGSFEEILAVLVKKGAKRKYRKVKLTFTPKPAEGYNSILKLNDKSEIVTTIDFQLAREVQLSLEMES